MADRAIWLEPNGGNGSIQEERDRGSTMLWALHGTVTWGHSAKPSSHPSIIKSVTVNIFRHERLSTLIKTENNKTDNAKEKLSHLFDKEQTATSVCLVYEVDIHVYAQVGNCAICFFQFKGRVCQRVLHCSLWRAWLFTRAVAPLSN